MAQQSGTRAPLPGRPVRESVSEYSELAMPTHANPVGTLFGGRVMSLVDLAGSIAAWRHARTTVVTASVDHMSFLHPVRIGQLVVLRASVNRVFRTSMEVGVKVCVEDLNTGEVHHTSSAYLTFVALDRATGRPVEIAPVIPETEEEKRRYEGAERRRELRLALREHTVRNWRVEG